MIIKWAQSARQSFQQIESIHFTREETKQYKIGLVKKIEQHIVTMSGVFVSDDPSWLETYRLLVDKYKVYYSFSEDKRICFIEAVLHQH
jgi:plasmid stabilization system protein ParE